MSTPLEEAPFGQRRRAVRLLDSWAIEHLAAELAGGIHLGETLAVSMLRRGTYEIAGAGARFVTVEVDEGSDPPRLLLTPSAVSSQHDLDIEVTFIYAGTTETLRFFIVPWSP